MFFIPFSEIISNFSSLNIFFPEVSWTGLICVVVVAALWSPQCWRWMRKVVRFRARTGARAWGNLRKSWKKASEMGLKLNVLIVRTSVKESDTDGQTDKKRERECERGRRRAGGRGGVILFLRLCPAVPCTLTKPQHRAGRGITQNTFQSPNWKLLKAAENDAEVFVFSLSVSRWSANGGVTKSPRRAPAMVTLRTGFDGCLNWLLGTRAPVRPLTRSNFTRSEHRRRENR